FFRDCEPRRFQLLVRQLARRPLESPIRFDPYLGGDRMSLEQRRGAFTGLTLATTRQQMLSVVIESLAAASAARLKLLSHAGVKPHRRVIVTGGVSEGLGDLLHRDWPGRWRFVIEKEATLRGLARLADE